MVARRTRMVLIITLVVIFIAVFSSVVLSQTFPAKVKVFVGRASNVAAQESYRVERLSLLKGLSSERPTDSMEAVLVLNRFVDPENLARLAQAHRLEVKEIFVAVPGRIGAGGHVLSSGESIGKALESFVQAMIEVADEIKKAPNVADEDIKYVQEDARLAREGKLLIYAARVSGKTEDLGELAEDEVVKLVDVFYDEKAEAVAKARGMRVVYIAVPERPDGIP